MEVAIVTGASKGLGRALAEGLLDEGWSLVIDARSADTLANTKSELSSHLQQGATVVAVSGDITSPSHRSTLIEAARLIGRLDLIVNNASSLGATSLTELADYNLDALRDVLEVNVISPVALVQQAMDLLRQSANPRVLNVTSDASVEHYERWGGYGLSKSALDHATLTLGVENPDVRSWAVDPGDLQTDMHQQAFPGEDISDRPLPESVVPELLTLIDSGLPSGRYKASELPVSARTASAGAVK